MPWFTIERTEVFRVEAPDAVEAGEILAAADDDSDYYSHTEKVVAYPDDPTEVPTWL